MNYNLNNSDFTTVLRLRSIVNSYKPIDRSGQVILSYLEESLRNSDHVLLAKYGKEVMFLFRAFCIDVYDLMTTEEQLSVVYTHKSLSVSNLDPLVEPTSFNMEPGPNPRPSIVDPFSLPKSEQ